MSGEFDLDLPSQVEGPSRRRPLDFAVAHGHSGAVKLLLDTGKVDAYGLANDQDLL